MKTETVIFCKCCERNQSQPGSGLCKPCSLRLAALGVTLNEWKARLDLLGDFVKKAV